MSVSSTRRNVLAAAAAIGVVGTARADLPQLRLGILQFGTVQWVADVVHRHGLDTRRGFRLRDMTLANNDAGRVSLMAGASDVVVSDWLFVAVQRAAGTKLSFAAFSSASGGIMTPAGATITSLVGLRGRKLGVAGGPVDKSWLLVQAAARKAGAGDLVKEAQVVYGAPPLLSGKLQQGELDAVLTFWNFAAKLEAAGFRQAVAVADCAQALGLSAKMSQVGFVFHDDWASANRPVIDGFLAAVAEAGQIMLHSDDEWLALRPLMDAPDDALFVRLRQRFREGIPHEDVAGQAREAARMFAILSETGGSRATDGIVALPPGIFWPAKDEAS